MNNPKNIHALQGSDAIEAQAATWLTVMGRENVSQTDLNELNQWLKQSDRHRAAFDRLSYLWEDLAILQELDDIAQSAIPETEPQPRPRSWHSRPYMAIAASLLIGVMVASLFYLQHQQGLNQQGIYVTGIGQQRSLHLSDGTRLQLNTDSRVEIDYSPAQRNIRLIKGEAHFDVAKNHRRPFNVHAGDGIVQAVGTAFTVRLRLRNSVEVTVEEGRVALTATNLVDNPLAGKHQSSHSSKAPASNTDQPAQPPVDRQALAELTAGQSAIFSARVEQLAQMQTPELNRKLAWRQGMLAYANDTLLDVVNDISRYTDINIEIADPALRNIPIAGYFRVGEVEALFDSLEQTFGLHVERINSKQVRLTARQ